MKVRDLDRQAERGPAERWRTESREVRELRLESMAEMADWSAEGLVLKRTMCSMIEDDDDILMVVDLRRRRVVVDDGRWRLRETVVVVTARIHSILWVGFT